MSKRFQEGLKMEELAKRFHQPLASKLQQNLKPKVY